MLRMKIVVQVKLMPDAVQAPVLGATLHTVNDRANWVSEVAFARGVPREYELRKHTYAELKAAGLGAQAAQHTIKKVCDAYITLRANLRAGNLGKPGSKRRRKAESKPVVFRSEAAHPFDDRCLSWQYDAQTVSIWTTAGRLKNVRFACSADAHGSRSRDQPQPCPQTDVSPVLGCLRRTASRAVSWSLGSPPVARKLSAAWLKASRIAEGIASEASQQSSAAGSLSVPAMRSAVLSAL
jgi:hypothetical protein